MTLKPLEKTKTLILLLLKDMVEATTAEIVNEASIISADCKDRVPAAIAGLNRAGMLHRSISREKKAIVWSLSGSVDLSLLKDQNINSFE
ncbi:MAG: hypothetical protein ACFFE8_09975 [Candidatus Heimdallarchaeota archaeon]